MDFRWRERLARWWCARFGHRIESDEIGTEWCLRCNRLLSTQYSRAKDANNGR